MKKIKKHANKPTIAELEAEKVKASNERRKEIQAYLDYLYFGRKI